MAAKSNIVNWNVDDKVFWDTQGRAIALRNLWFSIPALFLAFATWMMWSVIIVEMQNLGFSLGLSDPHQIKSFLYTLPAIAGLAGATLRIPNSFMLPFGGGRNVIFLTTALLLISAIGTGIALMDKDTPYFVFAIMALLSGFGGGNFSSSMANITTFFPKKMQGVALGLNAGIGNLGVSAMQFLLPISMSFSLLGPLSGVAIIGGNKSLYIQNAGFVWVPLIVLACLGAFFGMNNLKSVSPGLQSNRKAFLNIGIFTLCGLITSAIGVGLMIYLKLNVTLVMIIVITLTLFALKLMAVDQVKERLNKQLLILKDKHNWVMTIIYVMTFGSFIGYAASFPKMIQDVFGFLPDGSINTNAPNPMMWAWLGPFLGATLRPIGGWISDKVNSGSKVTAWSTVLQIIGALWAAYAVVMAKGAQNPSEYWVSFFCAFMLLFIGSGIGNGSTFRSVPYIFAKEVTPAVLGWIAAIGAYGSFLIPRIIGEQIANQTPEYAFYGFCFYYCICLFLNWWFYDRKGSEVKC